jgi:tape measure domain-containing protein
MKAHLKGVNKVSNKVIKGFGGLARFAGKAALGGILALGAGIGYVVKQFSKVEDAQAAFTPLLGGAEKAKEMVDKLNQTAATTPFQFETLAGASKQLLPVMNGDIEKTIGTMRMLGDTAGGNAQKLETITRGYTKAALKGKVDMESLNMIAEAGVPVFTELAKSMGKTVDKKFFKDISAGKVSVEDLTATFTKMTSEGGIFFKGMEIASQTTSGVFSTLKDNVQLTAASLGETLAPIIKDLMKKMIEVAGAARKWVAENQDLIKSRVAVWVEKIKTGIVALVEGIKKLLTNKDPLDRFWSAIEMVSGAIKWLVENAKGILIVIGIIGSLILIVKILTGVLTVINLVMAANPVTLIILAVIALIAILTTLFIKFKVWQKLVAFFRDFAIQIRDAWSMLKTFFADLWDNIVAKVKSGVDKVTGFIGPVLDKVSNFFGWGGGDVSVSGDGSAAMGVVTPGERTAHMISETRKSSTAEVTIKDESGRASVTQGELGAGVTLDRTGTF